MSRKIDALIAEHIVEWKNVNESAEGLIGEPPEHKYLLELPVPHYSTDIAAAWAVVDKMLYDRACYFVGFRLVLYADEFFVMDDDGEVISQAKTMPMAIALAALKAKGVEVGSHSNEKNETNTE